MSEQIKFMFDECLGEPMMRELKDRVPGGAELIFKHIKTYYTEGILDNEWIPQLSLDGGWIVISADRGRRASKGGKLPLLCKEYGITHVVLSSTLQNKKGSEKLEAILAVWSDIVGLQSEPPGTKAVVRFKPRRSDSSLLIPYLKIAP